MNLSSKYFPGISTRSFGWPRPPERPLKNWNGHTIFASFSSHFICWKWEFGHVQRFYNVLSIFDFLKPFIVAKCALPLEAGQKKFDQRHNKLSANILEMNRENWNFCSLYIELH
jgi:hypothetical protein